MKASHLSLFLTFFSVFAFTENAWAFTSPPSTADVGNGFTVFLERSCIQKGGCVYMFPEASAPPFLQYDFDSSFVYLYYNSYDHEMKINQKRYAVFDKDKLKMFGPMTLEEFQQSEHIAAGKIIDWKELKPQSSNNLVFMIVILGMYFCHYVLPILILVVILYIVIRGLKRPKKPEAVTHEL